MNALRRNPVLAAQGRRLMGGSVAAPADVALSDDLVLALRLGAAASGIDQAEFVRRAIAEKAARCGLPALATINQESGDAIAATCDPRLGHPLATRGSDESVAFNSAALTEDGDLTDLPAFSRASFPRFASGP